MTINANESIFPIKNNILFLCSKPNWLKKKSLNADKESSSSHSGTLQAWTFLTFPQGSNLVIVDHTGCQPKGKMPMLSVSTQSPTVQPGIILPLPDLQPCFLCVSLFLPLCDLVQHQKVYEQQVLPAFQVLRHSHKVWTMSDLRKWEWVGLDNVLSTWHCCSLLRCDMHFQEQPGVWKEKSLSEVEVGEVTGSSRAAWWPGCPYPTLSMSSSPCPQHP